ncbi:hypothetical protein XJ44_08865 [Thermosipho affectus]|uniref:ABC transmembrane type-1 domain-containing protein n=1 Tax=Thermosipho affectus TaxID=660294 RepID=A0ABX3IHB4_9BACT|nr:ABC transporter ATP-binding protein [Thermosipho affectus]ONN26561.1 hypothetical protein XJ44_08865 [Thermosipho affectus]
MRELIRWFFKIPKKLMFMIILMNLFGIISGLIVSYTTILSKDIINYAVSQSNSFFLKGLLLIIAVLISHILIILDKAFVSFNKGRGFKYLGEYCYERIMNKDFTEFSKKPPAFYSENSLRTIENLLEPFSNYADLGGIVFIFKVIFYMVTIYTLDRISGLFMIFFGILILLSLWGANVYYYKHSKIIEDNFLEIKSYVADMFKGIEEIQLFEAYNFEMDLYKKTTDPFWKYKKRLYFNDFILSFMIRDLISMVFYLFIIYRGVVLSDPGTFYALFNLFTLIRYQLFTLMGVWDIVRTGITAARQLEEVVG